MTGLSEALLANRTQIERELARAEEELEAVDRRGAELRQLIERARVALGIEQAPGANNRGAPMPAKARLTLHAALLEVLRQSGHPMTATELAEAVNASGLYMKRDGSPVDVGQIYARTHNYGSLFERVEGRIQARQPAGR